MPFDERKAREAVNFMQNLTMTEGEWAGQKFKLIPWEMQVTRDVFGIVDADGLRQYRTVYIEIPKKNGKSGYTSALGLKMFLADGEASPEVYCAAVDKNQAKIIFEAAEAMVQASRRLKSMCKSAKSIKTIQRRGKRGTFQALSADVPSKHGLKPSAVLIDEIHAFPSRKLFDVLTKGSGAARRQPLRVIITTAGERQEGVAWELHERAVKKLKIMKEKGLKFGEPGEPDPTFYCVVYGAEEGDDPEDEAVLLKANPAASQFPSLLADLKKEWEDAKGKPIDEAQFKWLRLNIWGMPTVERWLPVTVWDLGGDHKTPEDPTVRTERLLKRKSYGGLDLSETQDLTGWVQLFPVDGDKDAVEVLARIYCPTERINDKHNPNRDLYRKWADEGWIIPTSGPAIDYDHIREHVKADAKAYKLVDMNVDKLFQGSQIVQELQTSGLKALPFQQGFISYGPVMKEFERRLLLGKILHGGNPALRWMFENLKVERDASNNLKPNKPKSTAKIDGMAALIMALERVMRHQAKRKSTWKY